MFKIKEKQSLLEARTKALKRAEKEMQGYLKSNTDTKRITVEANSMEELLEKILAVDWNAVKPEEMPESGRKFDLSI